MGLNHWEATRARAIARYRERYNSSLTHRTYGELCGDIQIRRDLKMVHKVDEGGKLWEILVPTMKNDGITPFRTRYHKGWDKKVHEIAGGAQIFPVIGKGQWMHPETGVVYSERMIPVRIACTKVQLYAIMAMTKEYYGQHTVMAYKVSDEVLMMS